MGSDESRNERAAFLNYFHIDAVIGEKDEASESITLRDAGPQSVSGVALATGSLQEPAASGVRLTG